MFHKWLLASAALFGLAGGLAAQPYHPHPPMPLPSLPVASPIDGQWFFRGDARRPCYIQTVPGPGGPQLVLTNEKGTQAAGQLTRDGRQVIIPEWNLTGSIQGNAIVWPNGDFWGR